MLSYQYRKSHSGDKTILRPSYLHNGISYTGKMASLYWIGALGEKSRSRKMLVENHPIILQFGRRLSSIADKASVQCIIVHQFNTQFSGLGTGRDLSVGHVTLSGQKLRVVIGHFWAAYQKGDTTTNCSYWITLAKNQYLGETFPVEFEMFPLGFK